MAADEPDATAPTAMQPPATADDPTVMQPTAATTDQATLQPGTDVVRAAAARPPSSKGGTSRTVGEEMRAATIERFGMVEANRFEVLDELARGGLGRVFRARDPRTNRIVAIKEVLHSRHDIIVRFAREALVTANLQHPSIVPVYEVGRWQNGEPFYAMKLVQGRTLDQVIRETTTTDGRIGLLPHVIAVADALAYAHSERVIHRDLKPGNVLVGSYGETVVIDWGLAKNLATGEEIEELPLASTLPPDNNDTVVGSVLGTPAYMSPEQAQGQPIDEHADVYAIGAILYSVLTGQRPYAEIKELDELMEAVTTRPPRRVAELAPAVPAELIAIVEKAMAHDAAARYATAEGLAADLRRFQAGKLVAAHHYTTGQLLTRWLVRNRAIVATALVALIVLLAVGTASVLRIAKERDVAEEQRRNATTEKLKAEAATDLAQQRFAASLEEQARQALLAGLPDRALTLLASAARTGAPSEILAAQARKAYAGLVAIAPAQLSATTNAKLSADGRRIYLVASDGHAQAWDFATKQAVWTANPVGAIALAPDDRTLLVVHPKGELAIHDSATGAVIVKWQGPEPGPSAVRWAPDGNHFATIAPSGKVLFGDRTAGLRAADSHSKAAYGLEFSPDGKYFATVGADSVTLVHDGVTGATVARLVDGSDPLECVAWLDGDRVVTGDDKGAVRIWGVGGKHVIKKLQQTETVLHVTVGDGWLASQGEGPIVTVWDLATGTARARLGGHQGGSDYGVTDGTHLITTDETGDAYVWDPVTGERLQAMPAEGGTGTVVAARGGKVVVFGTGRTRVFQFGSDATLHHLTAHSGRIRDLVFSADSGTLWSASNDDSARGDNLVDGRSILLGTADYQEGAATNTTAPILPPSPHGLRSLTLTHDGKLVATVAEDGKIALWDARTGAARGALVGHTGRVRRLAFTSDDRLAYSVGDTTLRKWDVATAHELAHADLGANTWDVALFPGDQTVATMTEQNHARIWRTADLTPVHAEFTGRLREVAIAGDALVFANETRLFLFGPDGSDRAEATAPYLIAAAVGPKSIAVSDISSQLALFDSASLAPIRSWHSPERNIVIKLRPDGAILATASFHRVRLWDATSGNLLGESPEIPALVTQLAWSPDGHRLAFGGGSNIIFVWDLAPVDPAALAAFTRCVSMWRLDDASLVATEFDPASCNVSSAAP